MYVQKPARKARMIKASKKKNPQKPKPNPKNPLMHVKEQQRHRGMSSTERCPRGCCPWLAGACARWVSCICLLGNKRCASPGRRDPSPRGLSGTAATINIPKQLVRCSEGSVRAGSEAQRRGLGPCSDTRSLISVIRKCFRRVNECRYKGLWLSV